MLRRVFLTAAAAALGSLTGKIMRPDNTPNVRDLSVSVYATRELANTEGYRPLTVAQTELQYALNEAFSDRAQWYNVPDINVNVSAYGYGASHDHSIEVGTQEPNAALEEWIPMVQNDRIPYLGDANLLLTNHSGSGRAWSKAATAGATDLVENDLDKLTVRKTEGHIVHIEETLHMLGFGENEGVTRGIDYSDNGDVDRQVITPLWAGGTQEANLNSCRKSQSDIKYTAENVEVRYSLAPSACVEKQRVRIP